MKLLNWKPGKKKKKKRNWKPRVSILWEKLKHLNQRFELKARTGQHWLLPDQRWFRHWYKKESRTLFTWIHSFLQWWCVSVLNHLTNTHLNHSRSTLSSLHKVHSMMVYTNHLLWISNPHHQWELWDRVSCPTAGLPTAIHVKLTIQTCSESVVNSTCKEASSFLLGLTSAVSNLLAWRMQIWIIIAEHNLIMGQDSSFQTQNQI
jgi:hypothetical protein